MYLEQLKGKVVYLSLGLEDSNPANLIHTKRFKLTEMAKYLGASEVKMLQVFDGVTEDMIILDYYDSMKDNWFKDSCKLCISVYYCDLNKALTLEEIWYEGKKVGYLNYNKKKTEASLNKILQEEKFNFFKFEYINRDFTVDSAISLIQKNEEELKKQAEIIVEVVLKQIADSIPNNNKYIIYSGTMNTYVRKILEGKNYKVEYVGDLYNSRYRIKWVTE
jgi:hypothetical protein